MDPEAHCEAFMLNSALIHRCQKLFKMLVNENVYEGKSRTPLKLRAAQHLDDLQRAHAGVI